MKKFCQLVGDFNQDLINYENDTNCQNLVYNLDSSSRVKLQCFDSRLITWLTH